MNKSTQFSIQNFLISIFSSLKPTQDGLLISDFLKFCKSRKILPDLLTLQELNLLLSKYLIFPSPSKTTLSLSEFSSLIQEISDVAFKSYAAADRIGMMITLLKKHIRTGNPDLEFISVPLIEKKPSLGSKTNRHCASSRSILKKPSEKGKVLKMASNRESKSILNSSGTDALLKTLRSYEKSLCNSILPTGKHTRASSLDQNVEAFIGRNINIVLTDEDIVKKVKKNIEKLKKFEYAKKQKVQQKKKTHKCVDFIHSRRKNMFTIGFLVRLLFKSWRKWAQDRRRTREA